MQEMSRRNQHFTDSVIRRMTRISNECGAINLAQGFPDFDPPKEMMDRLEVVSHEGPHQYPITMGAPNFRQAIARKCGHFMGRTIDPETEIVATIGSTEAMVDTLFALTNPGDRVVMFSPFFENYRAQVIMADCEPVFVPLNPPTFSFDPNVLEDAFRGGAKAIMPGVSTPLAIQANHRLMVSPLACAGRLEGNPLREDIEEAAAICGVDYLVNVVLDAHKEIVKAVAGDVTLAHRAGCAYLDRMYRCPIPEKADIVLVSQGGAPKDTNLYQTQKALDNAAHAVKDGGVVILVGSCKEGLGEKVFEEWMTSAPTPGSLVERIQREFRLGGHKAAAIAMVLERAEIYLVSDLEDDLVRRLFMRPYHSVQEAYDTAVRKCGPAATVLAMPYGGSTLPRLTGGAAE